MQTQNKLLNICGYNVTHDSRISSKPSIRRKTFLSCFLVFYFVQISVACPGIRKGGGRKSDLNFLFFFAFQFFKGGPAQKIAEKMIFPTKKVAKYK